jgi:AraC-like DNA-binding protein
MVKYQEFIPHPVLQDCVKRFWILERAYTAQESIEEVVPDACVELILNFGSPYLQLGNTLPCELPKVCLVGLQSQPFLVQASGVVKIVAVRFFAWGVLPFLKPLAEPNSTTTVELDEAWHQVVTQVAAKVETEKYQQAVEELEAFLIGKRLTTWFDAGQVREAAKRLYETKGQVRVANLAASCNLSVRQLQRQFAETTGVSPKTLARTIRFETIRNRLMGEPDANLTDLAYEWGYTDQAHFIHDFQAFSKKTPGAFAQQMHKLQAMLHYDEHVVFLQSPSSMLDDTENNSVRSKGGIRDEEAHNDLRPSGEGLRRST